MERAYQSQIAFSILLQISLAAIPIIEFNITWLPNPKISIICIRHTYCDRFAPIGSVL
jgi:hypothetical protein